MSRPRDTSAGRCRHGFRGPRKPDADRRRCPKAVRVLRAELQNRFPGMPNADFLVANAALESHDHYEFEGWDEEGGT